MEMFLWFLLAVAVVGFGYFVVRHKDEFERLFRSDLIEAREEAKEAEDKFREAMRKLDDDAREKLSQKVKKIRARRKK